MNQRSRFWTLRKPVAAQRTAARHGHSLVVLCLLFPVILAISAFSINLVYMELARTELQIATDVATRAAGRVLAVTGSQDEAIAAAERLLQENPYCNQTLSIKNTDIVFGVSTRTSEFSRYDFGAGLKPNAVQVKSNGSSRVPMLFPTMGVPIDFRPIKSAISTQLELDVALVIDRSGSMAYGATEISGAGSLPPATAPLGWKFGDPVPPQSRWGDAVNAVNGFLDFLQKSGHDEHVSLSTYSSSEKVDISLSSDYTMIRQKLDEYSLKFDGGATNVGGGIIAGTSTLSNKKLARPWATRVMIVLTDGIHNTGTDPVYAAQLAANENLLIFTVTFSDEADEAKMQQVANIGLGKHIHAATGAELVDAFQEIAHSLPTLITY